MRVANLFAAALLFSGCTQLQTIDADGRCGNGVLEPESGEDCDRFPQGEGTACGERGTDHACLYVCDPVSGTPRCPTGWGCGLDGTCRAPSGELANPAILGLGASSLEVADVDGDGRSDLVSTANATVRVAFGDADGRFARTSELHVASFQWAPAIGDLDGDGLTDVAVVQPAGVLIARGRPNRALGVVSIPSDDVTDTMPDVIPLAVHAAPPYTREATLGLYTGQAGVEAKVLDAADGTDATEANGAMTGLSLASLHIAVGDLDAEPGSAKSADEVAFAPDNAAEVVLLGVECTEAEMRASCRVFSRGTIPLEAGWMADRAGVFMVDATGDGRLDVVLVVHGPAGNGLMIAENLGQGRFAPAHLAPALGAALTCTRCPGARLNLLAAGDLDGDGITDWVTQNGIFTTTSTAPFTVVQAANADTPWFRAEIADLNGDGRLDVAGIRPAGLDVLLAAGDGLFNTLQADVTEAPSAIAVGDFDGDLSTDLALVEGNVVSVLFGGRTGIPSDRVTIGEMEVRTMAARVGAGGLGRTSGLLLVTTGSDGRVRLIDVAGSSARRPAAPLRLEGRVDLLAIGQLDGTDAAEDLLLLGKGVDGTESAWLFSGSQLTGTALPKAVPLTYDASCFDGPTFNNLDARAFDVDGDGVDELAVMKHDLLQGPDSGTHALELWRVAGGHLTCTKLGAAIDVGAPFRMVAADVDGDGRKDVVVAFDSRTITPMARKYGPAIGIWWAKAGEPYFEADPTVIATTPDAPLSMMAAGQLDDDVADELVFVDDAGLGIADAVNGRGGLAIRGERTEAPIEAASIRAIAVLDPDGSGLEGVVLGSAEDLLVYPQRACTAKRWAEGSCDRRIGP